MSMNTLSLEAKVTMFIVEQSEDATVGKAHVIRYVQIQHFLSRYRRRFIKEGLVRLVDRPGHSSAGATADVEDVPLALCVNCPIHEAGVPAL
jgi:hypothetical protein